LLDVKAIQKHDFVCDINNAVYKHGSNIVRNHDTYDENNNNHVDLFDVGIVRDDDFVENNFGIVRYVLYAPLLYY